jgi:hypothetical protein
MPAPVLYSYLLSFRDRDEEGWQEVVLVDGCGEIVAACASDSETLRDLLRAAVDELAPGP